MIYTHVITFPSVWLPDPPCIRILVLGGDVTMLNQLCDQLMKHESQQNWALYHVPDPQIPHKELQDWILQQHAHVHDTWCHVDSAHVLTWAGLLSFSKIIHVVPEYGTLLSWAHMHMQTIDSLVQQITQDIHT